MKQSKRALLLSNSLDANAAAYFAAMPSQPNLAARRAINTFIVGLKRTGLWSKIDGGNILALATINQARIDFKAPSRVAAISGTPTFVFTAYRGIAGTGAGGVTDAIDTGFIPSSAGGVMAQNSAHLAVYSNTTGQVAAAEAGCNGTSDFYFSCRSLTDTFVGRSNNATTNDFGTSVTDGSGFFLVSRTGATTTIGSRNGTPYATVATASTALANDNIKWVQVTGGVGSTRQLGFGCYGAGLDATETSTLSSLVNSMMAVLLVQ